MTDTPLAGVSARVELLRDLDPHAEALRRLRGESELVVDGAATDADGLFTVTAREPGLYRLRFIAPGHATFDFRIPALVESIELRALPMPVSAEPSVLRVVDSDGRPVVSPSVSTIHDFDRRNWTESGRPRASTIWRAGAIDVYAERGSKAELDVSAPGHETRRVAVARIGSDLVRLSRRTGAIERSLVVVDAAGAAIDEAVLVDEGANPIAATNMDGKVRCVLAPGETIHVLLADGRAVAWTAGEAAEERIVVGELTALTGTVTGGDGSPLTGAWVGASVRWRSGEAPAALTPRAVTTDNTGHYLLPVLTDRELVAWAAAPGHVRGSGESRLGAATARRTLDFQLQASAIVEGVVVDGAGSPVLGAEIRVQSRGSPSRADEAHALAVARARTRDAGKFSIAMPSSTVVDLVTTARGFAPNRTETHSPAAGERSAVVIGLGRGSTLAGRVVDESGTPVAGAQATLEITPDDALGWSSAEPQTTSATENGLFAFEHLPSDLYDLAVTAPGHSAHRRPGITVSADRVELGDVVLQPAETLAGRVVDEADSPVAGAVVAWSAAEKPGSHWRENTSMVAQMGELDEGESGTRTDAEGRFTLTDLTAGQAIDLYADAEGYGLARAAGFVPPVAGEVEIRLRRAGALEGRIVDRSGEPMQISFKLERGERQRFFTSDGERGVLFGLSDTDGRFVVEDLAPGEWRIEVQEGSYERFERTVSVAAGETTSTDDIVLEREETAEVRGTVADGRGVGIQATVRAWGDSGVDETQTSPDGTYLLPAVALGEVRLFVRRTAGGAERVIRIVVTEGENTADVTLDGATVEGRVVDTEGNGLPGIAVELQPEHGSGVQGTTGAGGVFVLHDISPGRYIASAGKSGINPARERLVLNVSPEGESGVEIVMTPGAVISGRILGVPDRELSAVSVLAYGPGADSGARVLADGTYRVDGAAPGEWTIVGYAGNFREARKTVSLAPDAPSATADLDFSSQGFVLRGRVGGPDGPIQDGLVTLRDLTKGRDAIASRGWTDHEGSFLFGPLAAGTYMLEAYPGSSQNTPPIATRVLTIEDDVEVFLNAPLAP